MLRWYDICCFGIKIGADIAKFTKVSIAGLYSEDVRFWSEKVRCRRRQNSVLEELRVGRLGVRKSKCCRAFTKASNVRIKI